MRARIRKIGFEIEGEFSPDLHNALVKDGVMKGDGSVHYCRHVDGTDMSYHKKFNCNLLTGEYNSPALEVDDKKIKKIFQTFQKAYEKGQFHWNKSAGFHVHVSFSPKVPPEIRHSKFSEYALERLEDLFPKEYKERSKNSYCKTEDLSDNRFIHSPHDRYRALNYYSFKKHKTLEFRIFPANEPDKMYEYLQSVIALTNEYLNRDVSLIEELEPLPNKEEIAVNHREFVQQPNFAEPSERQIRVFAERHYGIDNIYLTHPYHLELARQDYAYSKRSLVPFLRLTAKTKTNEANYNL